MLKNIKFAKRLSNLPQNIGQKIGEIRELKGQWTSGAELSPQILGRLKRSTLITSSGASTRIEGAKLSDEDVEKLMSGLVLQKFADRDKQEVRGYYELLENVFDAWRTIRFSENTIKHLHKELLKYVEKDERHRGDYKSGENEVVMTDEKGNIVATVFKTTPAFLTPKETQELIVWTQEALKNKEYEPLLVIANFLVEFLNIHPFQDGNGRLSRVLTNLLLLQEGYLYMPYISHEKIVEDNKTSYYLALRRTQKTLKTEKEDITPWLDYFFGIFLKQSEMAIELLRLKDIEKILSPAQLKVWQYLLTVTEATPREISETTEVYRPTINQVLERLLKLKKIERIGLGRATRYKKIVQK